MKNILIFIFLMAFDLTANAMCSFAGINLWPSKENISTNSIFVIEGYSHSQQLIRQLNKKNKIYLKCGSEIISINVLKILEGQFNLTQAILKPEKELIIGNTYELHIDSLGMFDKDEYEVVKWTVNSKADVEKPVWNCEPIFKGLSYTAYGCGPAKFVNFCGSYTDNSPTLIYAKVYDKKNKTISDYFLTNENQKISIGHGMCSGEFSFEKNANYQVQFGLMDASGNENLSLTKAIEFTSPTKDNHSKNNFNCNCTNTSRLLIYGLVGLGIILLGFIIYKKQKNASS